MLKYIYIYVNINIFIYKYKNTQKIYIKYKDR